MINIAICDDDVIFADKLENDLKIILKKRNKDWNIIKFNEGTKLQEQFKTLKFDAIYLDIDMPDIDGYKIAAGLSEKGINSIIIFVSCKPEKVFYSFDYDTFWFIPKNKMDTLFEYVTNRMIDRIHVDNILSTPVRIKLAKKDVEINLKDVMYIRSAEHYVEIIKHDKKSWDTYRCTLDEVESMLKDFWFIRIHQRFLVNCYFITNIDDENKCYLLGKEKLSISKSYEQRVKEKYHDYLRYTKNG